ncbi:sugar phosphate isomerase/epimerase, partial [Holdemanella biformis]
MMNFKDKLCGMNSHYRFYSFERFFQEMNRLGIKNVEIWTGPMHFYVDYNKNQSV